MILQVEWKENMKKIGVFRSRFISETMQDTAIVTMEDERNSYTIYRIVPLTFPMTLSDSPRFQGHDIIQRQVSRKWYKTKLYL